MPAPERSISGLRARSLRYAAWTGSPTWVQICGLFHEGCTATVQQGRNSIKWTSKYGSVVASAFEAATADGMNEKGLVANMLYLAESQYPQAPPASKSQPMSVSVWTQYVLDNYATVDEVVAGAKAETFYVLPVPTADGHEGTVHLAVSDPSGDSAIFEYIDGKLIIHHGKFQVMTNSPVYDQQLALNAYWQQIGSTAMLPGTNRPAIALYVRRFI
jgi:penicillin V acylase-like amidase (Ntn superfamily)